MNPSDWLTPAEVDHVQNLYDETDEDGGEKLPALASLDALIAESKYENIKGAAYKTVATFAGLTKRKLWLVNGTIGATDGFQITAPFDNPDFYRIVEHELAHVLFQSDRTAANAFIEAYVNAVEKAYSLNATGRVFSPQSRQTLISVVNGFIGVLEDERIESLWGLLYPGSAARLLEMRLEAADQMMRRKLQHHSLEICFAVIHCRVPITDGRLKDSKFLRFLPQMEEALKKVQYRGFGGTLAVAKWLLQQVVSEMLKEMQPPQQQQPGAQPQPGGQPGQQPQPSQGQPQGASAPVGAPNGAKGAPTNLLDRVAALDKLLGSTTSDDIPSAIHEKLNDFDENKYRKNNVGSVQLGRAMAQLNVGDDATLDRTLRNTQAEMQRVVEEVKTALAKQMPQDGWLTKDAFAKVNFKDEAKDATSFRLQPDDDFWSKRLRSQFVRVLGRRKYSLHDTGSVIDVSAYIEGLLSYEPVPCFHTEDLGRGFKALVLLDRSNSMSGEKTAQAERACKILLKSLDFPFVDLHVWGFQSKAGGEVDITRFHKSAPNFTKTTAKVGGTTPLHTALRLGRRFLEEGTDAKLLIPVTDGFPCHTSKRGFQYSTRALLNFSRSEVLQAKAGGVKISSVIIGNDLRDFQLNHLFGSRNWKRVGSSDVGRALVQVITSGFIHYLLRG